MAGFVIPNKADVGADNSQAQLDATDFRTIVAGFDAISVVADVGGECAVTATGTPDQNVQIAAGEISSSDSHFTVAAGALAMPAAHATLNRYDLVVIDAAGVKRARSGPEAVSPVFPVPTAGDVVLAAVWRPAADNTIGGGDITDKRIIRRHRASAPLGGQYVTQLPTVTDQFPYGARWVTPADRDLMILRYGDGGAAGERSNRLWLFPPVDGGRVGFDFYSSAELGNDPLLNFQSHGRTEGNLPAPGVQHFTWYEPLDTWTARTAVNEAAGIPAGAKGDSVVFTVDATTNLAVNDEILVWDTTKVPGVDVPTSSWEYMRITAINTLDLTCTRQIWGEREAAPAHVDNALVYEVTRTSVKVLQICHGPDSDGRTAGALRIHLPNADLDLTQNKLLLNGTAGVLGGGTAWLEWDEGARLWTLTGVGGDGAALRLSRDTGTDEILQGFVAGQANPYFTINALGGLGWGPGSGAVDLGLGRGDVGRLDLSANNRLTLSGTGALSVGTTNAPPQAYENGFLTPRTGQTHAALRIAGVGASAFADGGLYFVTSRGTLASPTASVSGDRMGVIEFYAYDGDEFHRPSAIQAVVDGTVANNQVPSRLEFHTSPTVVGSRVERARITSTGLVRIGPSTVTPAARSHIHEATLGDEVQRLESLATNDDPRESIFQGRVATATATATAMTGLTARAVPANTTVGIEAVVVARRTGGASGTAEDGAMYVIRAVVKNVAGTATIIGATSITVVGESQAGWTADIGVLGGNWFVAVTGAASNDITWHATARVWPVGS